METQKLQSLINSIAAELPGFRAKEIPEGWRGGYIVRESDGLEIRAHISRAGRLELSMSVHSCEAYRVAPGRGPGSFRDALEYNEKPPMITVSPDKAPSKIAKDITSRLLPGCEDLHERCLDVVRKVREYDQSVLKNMEVLGLERNPESLRVRDMHADVSVFDDRVSINIDGLSVEQASKVLELFRSLTEG